MKKIFVRTWETGNYGFATEIDSISTDMTANDYIEACIGNGDTIIDPKELERIDSEYDVKLIIADENDEEIDSVWLSEYKDELTRDVTYILNTDEPEDWGDDAYNGMEIDRDELRRLAEEWGTPITELLRQVEVK